MTKYRMKPVEVEAVQWFKMGDHPAVVSLPQERGSWSNSDWGCCFCDKPVKDHGWLPHGSTGTPVCPGDWIITDAVGGHSECSPEYFTSVFEAVE